MKEKIVCIAAAVCLLAGALSGCGAIKAAEAQPSHFPIPSTVPQSPAVGTDVPQDMKENVNTAWLPSGVKQQKSETKIFFDGFELRLKSFIFLILTQCFKRRDGFLAVDDASFCISSQLFDARNLC